MRGKYSPTISEAYYNDQKWFERYANGEQYDPEGYDSYGYDVYDIDRAGNHENEYCRDDPNSDFNSKYDAAQLDWGFDGTKPVLISAA